jgi:hypothetical protein
VTDAAQRIVLVEDEPAHAEAVRRALETAVSKIELEIVGTLSEY